MCYTSFICDISHINVLKLIGGYLMKKNGFTLAEVLITLTILGVVAAITIPNIVHNYKKQITVVKLKKAYANLEQAAVSLKINSGCHSGDIACTGLFESDNVNERFFELAGIKISKIQGSCSSRGMSLGCENQNCTNTAGRNFGNNYDYYIGPDKIGYRIARTSSINIVDSNGEIKATKGLIVYVFTENKHFIGSDRNKWLWQGRNLFAFVIYGDFIVEPLIVGFGSSYWPMSLLNKHNYTSENNVSFSKTCNPEGNIKNENGGNCLMRIIQDGWKINY